MIKIVLGLTIGFVLGAACRWLDIPAPAPPKLVGAMVVVAVTLGYASVDAFLTRGHAGEPNSSASAK